MSTGDKCDTLVSYYHRRYDRFHETDIPLHDHIHGAASEMSENATRVRNGKLGSFHEALTTDDLANIDQVVAEVGISRDWVYYDAEEKS